MEHVEPLPEQNGVKRGLDRGGTSRVGRKSTGSVYRDGGTVGECRLVDAAHARFAEDRHLLRPGQTGFDRPLRLYSLPSLQRNV